MEIGRILVNLFVLEDKNKIELKRVAMPCDTSDKL